MRAATAIKAAAQPHPEIPGVLVLRSAYVRKHGFGRRVADHPSLQGAPKRVRGPVAARFYHDIDVENCHYVLMLQIADQHGADLPSVRRYVQDRDAMIATVRTHYRCGRDSAKTLFLAVLNGGTADRWLTDASIDDEICRRIKDPEDDTSHVDIVEALMDDYKAIQGIMFEKYGDNLQSMLETYQRARPDKNATGVRRSVFSLCLQTEEDRVLGAMDAYLADAGHRVDVLVYDGLMVRRKGDAMDARFPASVLAACEDAVHARTGYRVQLAEKCLHCGVAVAKCTCCQ
jgi:hypothetical protein